MATLEEAARALEKLKPILAPYVDVERPWLSLVYGYSVRRVGPDDYRVAVFAKRPTTKAEEERYMELVRRLPFKVDGVPVAVYVVKPLRPRVRAPPPPAEMEKGLPADEFARRKYMSEAWRRRLRKVEADLAAMGLKPLKLTARERKELHEELLAWEAQRRAWEERLGWLFERAREALGLAFSTRPQPVEVVKRPEWKGAEDFVRSIVGYVEYPAPRYFAPVVGDPIDVPPPSVEEPERVDDKLLVAKRLKVGEVGPWEVGVLLPALVDPSPLGPVPTEYDVQVYVYHKPTAAPVDETAKIYPGQMFRWSYVVPEATFKAQLDELLRRIEEEAKRLRAEAERLRREADFLRRHGRAEEAARLEERAMRLDAGATQLVEAREKLKTLAERARKKARETPVGELFAESKLVPRETWERYRKSLAPFLEAGKLPPPDVRSAERAHSGGVTELKQSKLLNWVGGVLLAVIALPALWALVKRE